MGTNDRETAPQPDADALMALASLGYQATPQRRCQKYRRYRSRHGHVGVLFAGHLPIPWGVYGTVDGLVSVYWTQHFRDAHALAEVFLEIGLDDVPDLPVEPAPIEGRDLPTEPPID